MAGPCAPAARRSRPAGPPAARSGPWRRRRRPPWAFCGEFARWPAAHDSLPDCSWTQSEPLDALAWDSTGQSLDGLSRESGGILLMQRGQASVRRLTTVPKGSGRLSGLAVDGAGGVGTALEEGWSLVRFSADGNQDRVIGPAVPCPSDMALGGENLDTLYVISARHAVSLEALGNAPLSGRLFGIEAAE